MASGVRLNAWAALAAGLALGALVGWRLPLEALDWQPALAFTQPWRAFSAAFVHLSALHLVANLIGCALVAAWGWRAGCDRTDALAWALAWPLTHLALLLQPQLLHYGGLSGVLHAGVAVAALRLLFSGTGRARTLGAAVLAGLVLKLLMEAPWSGPLRPVPGWDFVVAPLAHAAGAAAGMLAFGLIHLAAKSSRRRAAPAG